MAVLEENAIKIAETAAIKAHRGQFRRDGKTPFSSHPRRVAACTRHHGGGYKGIIAAWLHDVIEDCRGGNHIVLETLSKTGLPEKDCSEIYTIISAVTKNPKITGKSQMLADSIRRINCAPPQAVLIKICDRIDNLSDAERQTCKFLSEYVPMTGMLITGLSVNARKYGYTIPLSTLKLSRDRANKILSDQLNGGEQK